MSCGRYAASLRLTGFAGHRRFAPDASNPAVPTGVSSRSHPLVKVSGNSSDRLGRPVKGRPRYFTYMEHVRLVPGDLPAQWRQRDSWTELGVLLVRDGSHKIKGTLRI